MKNRCFTYVNAAHSPPLIFRNASKTINELAIGKESLGRLGNIELQEHQIKIETGDILLFYTDGVIKALDGPDLSGEDVLGELVMEYHELSSSRLVEEIKNIVVQSETNLDDLVLAVLKVD
jgi:phosphoserine phosphatase RsbU/P